MEEAALLQPAAIFSPLLATPNHGAMMAFSSGYSAGVKAAEYLKKNS